MTALAMSGTASAGIGPPEGYDSFEAGDPMTVNVPYVAWAGEEVRLVKCYEDEGAARFLRGTQAEWNIVDSSVRQRSGELRDPVFFDDRDGRTPVFQGEGEQDGRACWAIDVESVHPGMTRIEMGVDDPDDGRTGSPILKHDFLVIWLGMNSPTLTELGESAFPGIDLGDQDGGNPASYTPRDIDGDGDLEYGPGLIRVGVTGSFTDLHGNARTLPADWDPLARRYANGRDGYNKDLWDIHDDQNSLPDKHTTASFCAELGNPIDAVDNCQGSDSEVGPFSRTIGNTFATLGPFDPARPGSSYLPDGKLDAGDAPMPAARIDLSVAGGVGSLEEADKHEIYSVDRAGTVDNTATAAVEGKHNLYAPFYAALIPADAFLPGVDLDYTTSGTHGALANNFEGYQAGPFPNFIGIYHYWDFVLSDDTREGSNKCKDVGGEDGQFGNGGGLISGPFGVDEATVYTDEHGEALVWFIPDVGAEVPFDNAADEAQGLCDLGESPAAELLGTATISAEAKDPFKPTFSDPRLATALVKNVNELAYKAIDCVPKTAIEAFCVEVIYDIWGNPVQGAPVLFSADPMDRIIGAQIVLGGYDTTGAACSAPNASDEVLCTTNAKGQAGVLVVQTHDALVNVVAENVATRNGGFGILRDRCVDFSGGAALPTDGPSCATPTDSGTPIVPVTTPPAGGGTNPAGGGATNSGNPAVVQQSAAAATVVSLAGSPVPAAKAPEVKKPAAKAAALKLASARFVYANGKRFLVVRANGAAKVAKVRITLVMRTGKVMKPVVRTIPTNRAVRVANLQISKHVLSVRVSLAK